MQLDAEMQLPAGKKRPVLIVLQGESVGQVMQIANERTVMGRGAQADIVLKDDVASRLHAEITSPPAENEGQSHCIKDLSSTNGTYLNGARIASQEALQDGDKIRVGNHLLKFSLLDEVEIAALLKSQVASPGEHQRSGSTEHLLCFPPFHIPESVDLLYKDDTVISLEPQAVKVLRYLAENHGRVITKNELLEAVWPDVFTTDSVLKKAVSQARHALGDDVKEARFIETYHRRGYRFTAPVSRRVRHYT
jgi:DNA-binding winged helix-turn-helix (wHTH) protein